MCHRYFAFLLPALLSLAGCTVYAPLQPPLPHIRERGQGEVRGSVQAGSGRAELALAYSPLRYVLLGATGCWRPAVPDPASFRAQLGEVGLGGYYPLPHGLTLSGLVGFGGGETARPVGSYNLLDEYSRDYFARYHTRFAQLGALYRYDPQLSLGLGYRLTQVRYSELYASYYTLPPENQLRHELFGQVRHNLGQSCWQLELSGALSLALPGRDPLLERVDPIPYHVSLNRGGALLLGVGVVYRVGKRREGE